MASTAVNLVFQGLIAFVPTWDQHGVQRLTALVVEASPKTIPQEANGCVMVHDATITFQVAAKADCEVNGYDCTFRPQNVQAGPKVNACECKLVHDLIEIGNTTANALPGIDHQPPHDFPQANEDTNPAYIVNMSNIGASYDPAHPPDLNKALAARIENIALGLLTPGNYSHVQGDAKHFRFWKLGQWELGWATQALATGLAVTTRVDTDGVNLVLTDDSGRSKRVRKFNLPGASVDLLIENEPAIEHQDPCASGEIPPGCDAAVGYDFGMFYQVAAGNVPWLDRRVPHTRSDKHKNACQLHVTTSKLESPPHFEAGCHCPQPLKDGETKALGGGRKAITSRPICPMAVFN
jgi:hypothetical protein